jgi:hypothetical protein
VARPSPEHFRLTVAIGCQQRAADKVEHSWIEARFVGGPDLGARSATPPRSGETPTLRWVVLHLIEENARHNGHLDLLRELADGVTGE